MPSPQEGILNGKEWDDVNLDLTPEWRLNKEWKPTWKPASSVRKCKRTLGRIRTSISLKSPPLPEKLRPTAYLDGLRGFAAFLVYWHHHQLWAHGNSALGQNDIFENGFGYKGNYHLATFHGIRHFFSGGHYAVATFFVISGYVLSVKPLGLIHNGDFVKLGDNLASALFRRWLRLYLPIIGTVVSFFTIWHALGIWISKMKPQGSWGDELWAFYLEFKNFSFIFTGGGGPWLSYNVHVWSIPNEFKGSIVIYTSLMAFSRCSRNARLWCEVGLVYYFLYIADGWYCAMFAAGMLLCDLDLLAKSGELPCLLARLECVKDFIYYHLLVLSLFLGGVPSENRNLDQVVATRGWYYLSYLKPQAVFDYKWFYLFWAATLLVAAVPRIHWLKRFFETWFCQYLGRISYSLYLVHGPVLWMLGDRLYAATGWQTEEHLQNIPRWVNKVPLPKAGPLGLEVSFLVPHAILLPVTLCVAEFVTRAIDTPSVKVAAWLYAKILGKAPVRQAQA